MVNKIISEAGRKKVWTINSEDCDSIKKELESSKILSAWLAQRNLKMEIVVWSTTHSMAIELSESGTALADSLQKIPYGC